MGSDLQLITFLHAFLASMINYFYARHHQSQPPRNFEYEALQPI